MCADGRDAASLGSVLASWIQNRSCGLIAFFARGVQPQHLCAARREDVGRRLVFGQLPAVELGIARYRPATTRAVAAIRSPRSCRATTTTSGSNEAIVSGHFVSHSAHAWGTGTSWPNGSRTRRCRPRLHDRIASFCTIAAPVSAAHSSNPRPKLSPDGVADDHDAQRTVLRERAVEKHRRGVRGRRATDWARRVWCSSRDVTLQHARLRAQRRQHDARRRDRGGDQHEAPQPTRSPSPGSQPSDTNLAVAFRAGLVVRRARRRQSRSSASPAGAARAAAPAPSRCDPRSSHKKIGQWKR